MQAEAAAQATPRSKKPKMPAAVPDYLIYEVDEGQPIYYRGYKEVVKKTKTSEEIMSGVVLNIEKLLAEV